MRFERPYPQHHRCHTLIHVISLSQIPLLQRAQALSAQPLNLFASAWSAPAWLKTNGALIGKGSLKGKPGGKEHKTWAQYYIRCVKEPKTVFKYPYLTYN